MIRQTLLDELSDRAQQLQAVNTVVFQPDGRRIGHNTDWCGFAHSLQRNLPDADLSHVVLMGAGGAGLRATFGLARAGLLDARRHTSNAADFLAASGAP